MKTLPQFLEDLMATPGNTMGAGNPALPGMNGEIGSGDLLVRDGDIKIKQKKRRRRKKYQDEDDEERNSR